MVKNLIFDVYGTLVSSGNGSVKATEAIFREFGYTEGFDKIYKRWKQIHREHYMRENFVTERDIYVEDLAQLFDEMSIDADASVKVAPMHKSLYGRNLFPDVSEAMAGIIDSFNVAIGSITDDEPLKDSMSDTVLERIELVYTSESLRKYKPNPAFYKEILEKTGWNPDETVFVGDSMENDVLGPQSVGLRAVLIDRKGGVTPELASKADAVITAMTQLADVLKTM